MISDLLRRTSLLHGTAILALASAGEIFARLRRRGRGWRMETMEKLTSTSLTRKQLAIGKTKYPDGVVAATIFCLYTPRGHMVASTIYANSWRTPIPIRVLSESSTSMTVYNLRDCFLRDRRVSSTS